MNKRLIALKSGLLDVAEIVNTFKSDAVQSIVIDYVLNDLDSKVILFTDKPGVTKIINYLIGVDYFQTPRTINEINFKCNELSETVIYTNQVSGILIEMVRQAKLLRQIDAAIDQYIYVSPLLK